MLEGLELPQLTTGSDIHFFVCHHNLAIMICNPPMQCCFFTENKKWPSPLKVEKILEYTFEDNHIETITFKK
jgi:hypothetical protein